MAGEQDYSSVWGGAGLATAIVPGGWAHGIRWARGLHAGSGFDRLFRPDDEPRPHPRGKGIRNRWSHVAQSLAGLPSTGLIDRLPMQLSQGDRNELISRVEQRLGGRAVSRATVQSAVDQVLAGLALPDESSTKPQVIFAVSAESMPDLASRVRQKLDLAGAELLESGTATVGRYTVVTLRAPDTLREPIEQAARELGAHVTIVPGGDASGGRS